MSIAVYATCPIYLAGTSGLEPESYELTARRITDLPHAKLIWCNGTVSTCQPPVLQTGALPIELPLQIICYASWFPTASTREVFPRGFALLTLVLSGSVE